MSKELLPLPEPLVIRPENKGYPIGIGFTADQMREYAIANRNHATAKPAETCNYPDCNCPFDAPADPNWCARGLPKSLEKISERHLRQDLYLFGLKGLLADPAILDHIPAVKALREESERLNDRCMYWAGQFEAEQGKRIEASDRHKSEITALESQLAELRQGGEAQQARIAELEALSESRLEQMNADRKAFNDLRDELIKVKSQLSEHEPSNGKA